MRVLAIETSCDETAAAVVKDGREVLSNVVSSQVENHIKFGGVVPEIASRMHIEEIGIVYKKALADANLSLSDIDGIAVTAFPGLIGALLVGVNFAKSLAYAAGLPLIAVHHLKAHIAANYIAFPELAPPFVCLLVSGGHTEIIKVDDYLDFTLLGSTRDDAAGECFDKVARSLGLPYPGGVNLDKICTGEPCGKYIFPSPKVDGAPLDMSFSGLKTAAINILHNAAQKNIEIDKAAFADDFSESVSRELCGRVETAFRETGYKKLVLAGGVAANSRLRKRASELCERVCAALYAPPLSLCGDNAAMVGAAGFYEAQAGNFADVSLNAKANCEI